MSGEPGRGFHFVANLKPYTFNRGTGNDRFDAYLLSITYAKQMGDLASAAVREGRVLCADNGNVEKFGAMLEEHAPRARELDVDRLAEERVLGRYVRPGDLSAGLRDRFRAFADDVRASSSARHAVAGVTKVVASQNALAPTYVIGMEDFTIATLVGVGAEPEYLGLEPSFFEPLADRAVQFAVDTQAGVFGPCRSVVFAGVHAADFDTARIAGRAAGRADVAGLATGLVGALRDKGYVDFRVEDGRVIELGRAVPRPYLRVAEIAAGLHAGFVETSGRRPHFHALGAGSPILLPLLAALGDGTTYTAADSTAPIIDGWSGPTISLYVDDPAPLKYKAYRIAEAWLRDDKPWACPCPYCRAFDRAYAPRVDEARRWWRDAGSPTLSSTHVSRTSPLSALLPLLSNADDPGLRLTAAMARVGHNHWIMQRLERAARKHSTSPDALITWVADVVAAYLASPADASWKAAVSAAWTLIRQTAERTRHAAPSPRLR